jgi:hypothetical protein
MYRVHIFGMLITTIALIELASVVVETPARVMVWSATGDRTIAARVQGNPCHYN